jgi:hypothetical protein
LYRVYLAAARAELKGKVAKPVAAAVVSKNLRREVDCKPSPIIVPKIA